MRESAESGIIEAETPPALYDESAVRDWIASAACSKVLRVGRQRIHIPGTKEYADNVEKYARNGQYGPSVLSITEEEAHELGLKYMGTGQMRIRQGGWDGIEIITDNPREIGIAVDNRNGKKAQTSVFKIHYSRRGFHITPDYPSKKKGG